ncbi:tetratricopeptide repeat protein [Chitinophaga solisilvae]|uniref:Tetratricopeptide repeat protein n=1 Tax=Chitinophaga solisilvae TaxID=1233460 RepID=A0A433W993_9BACT|nr:tetratricopeptide repeat protein [Chitinophaga solisilvae]NSL85974.1 tetratricopeptide repeat protein [Chitinophaga solisilvae]
MQLIPCILITCLLYANTSDARQKDSLLAREKCIAALAFMESGDPAQSVPLLQEAIRLDPGNEMYVYEMAAARYALQEYDKAITVLQPLTRQKPASPLVYVLLGHCYDDSGKRSKARETYDRALQLFPEAGNLYTERGMLEMQAKEYERALIYFETGILASPMHAANYYWASKLFCNSSEKVWGMIYGEVFLNLEKRNPSRIREISKLLYLTYKSDVHFPGDTAVTVDFSRGHDIAGVLWSDAPGELTPSFRTPYSTGIYQPFLLEALQGEKIISLPSLHRARTRFLSMYELREKQQEATPLFDYQLKVRAAGFLEAYNYWILGFGDERDFEVWRLSNPALFRNFLTWQQEHPLVVTDTSRVFRRR